MNFSAVPKTSPVLLLPFSTSSYYKKMKNVTSRRCYGLWIQRKNVH